MFPIVQALIARRILTIVWKCPVKMVAHALTAWLSLSVNAQLDFRAVTVNLISTSVPQSHARIMLPALTATILSGIYKTMSMYNEHKFLPMFQYDV